jgi:hypothetical protein
VIGTILRLHILFAFACVQFVHASQGHGGERAAQTKELPRKESRSWIFPKRVWVCTVVLSRLESTGEQAITIYISCSAEQSLHEIAEEAARAHARALDVVEDRRDLVQILREGRISREGRLRRTSQSARSTQGARDPPHLILVSQHLEQGIRVALQRQEQEAEVVNERCLRESFFRSGGCARLEDSYSKMSAYAHAHTHTHLADIRYRVVRGDDGGGGGVKMTSSPERREQEADRLRV